MDPSLSLMYGDGLLLCKVLLGNCQFVQAKELTPFSPDIPAHCDSREVRFGEDGVIQVVRSPAQILPYCVIKLRSDCVNSLVVNPSLIHTKVGSVLSNFPKLQTPQTYISLTANVSWTNVYMKREFGLEGRDKNKVVLETVRKYSLTNHVRNIEDKCSICCDRLGSQETVNLLRCRHTFHLQCLTEVVEQQTGHHHVQCPNCQTVHGVKTGNMPTTGRIMYTRKGASLPGYPGCPTIIIMYVFNNGTQDETHPNPGKPFYAKGFPRLALLPSDTKGERVLTMLITAFQRGLTFTIGRSVSRGEDDCVIWNGIHHKTAIKDNGSGHGYPDMDYLDRVMQELRSQGVTG